MTINKKQILIPLELNGLRIDSAVHKLLPRSVASSYIEENVIPFGDKDVLPLEEIK